VRDFFRSIPLGKVGLQYTICYRKYAGHDVPGVCVPLAPHAFLHNYSGDCFQERGYKVFDTRAEAEAWCHGTGISWKGAVDSEKWWKEQVVGGCQMYHRESDGVVTRHWAGGKSWETLAQQYSKWQEQNADKIEAAERTARENQRKSAVATVKFLKSIPVGWWAVTLPKPWSEPRDGDSYSYDDPSLKLPPDRLKFLAERLELKVREVSGGFRAEGPIDKLDGLAQYAGRSNPMDTYPWHKFFPTEEEAQTWWEQVYCKRYPDVDVTASGGPRGILIAHPELIEQTYGPGYKLPPPREVEKYHRVNWERVLLTNPRGSHGLYYELTAMLDDGSNFSECLGQYGGED
jgi:hypothetical protein